MVVMFIPPLLELFLIPSYQARSALSFQKKYFLSEDIDLPFVKVPYRLFRDGNDDAVEEE
jgi:hypothetical protein